MHHACLHPTSVVEDLLVWVVQDLTELTVFVEDLTVRFELEVSGLNKCTCFFNPLPSLLD